MHDYKSVPAIAAPDFCPAVLQIDLPQGVLRFFAALPAEKASASLAASFDAAINMTPPKWTADSDVFIAAMSGRCSLLMPCIDDRKISGMRQRWDYAAIPWPNYEERHSGFSMMIWFHKMGISEAHQSASKAEQRQLRSFDCVAAELGADRLMFARASEQFRPATVDACLQRAKQTGRQELPAMLAVSEDLKGAARRTRRMAIDMHKEATGAYVDLSPDPDAWVPAEVLAIGDTVREQTSDGTWRECKTQGQHEVLQHGTQFRLNPLAFPVAAYASSGDVRSVQ